jgi:hypothetical protein
MVSVGGGELAVIPKAYAKIFLLSHFSLNTLSLHKPHPISGEFSQAAPRPISASSYLIHHRINFAKRKETV